MANKDTIVTIPTVARGARIGSVFNQVFSVMFQTEQTDTDSCSITWDFSNCSFLHPFYLASLSIIKARYPGEIECKNVKPYMQSYFDIVHFNHHYVVKDGAQDSVLVRNYSDKTYLPICRFNPLDNSSTAVQELARLVLKKQIDGNDNVCDLVSYLLGELIDNITDHSFSREGFLYCQRIPKEKTLYVFIADTGRSIYSSYAADKRYAGLLTELESSAMALALSGRSTKNRPENENRGYGISKSRDMIVNGLGGEFFIMSGGSFFHHDTEGETLVDLPEYLRWDGTVVLLKIPTTIPEDFNLYDYIS